MSKRLWLDTHVHVSDYGAEGEFRPRLLEDLLQVLDSEEADLRFVISPDGLRLSRLAEEPGGVTAGNEFIRDLVQRAPVRLHNGAAVQHLRGAVGTLDAEELGVHAAGDVAQVPVDNVRAPVLGEIEDDVDTLDPIGPVKLNHGVVHAERTTGAPRR